MLSLLIISYSLVELNVGNTGIRHHWNLFQQFLAKLAHLRVLQLEACDLESQRFEQFFNTLAQANQRLQCLQVGTSSIGK